MTEGGFSALQKAALAGNVDALTAALWPSPSPRQEAPPQLTSYASVLRISAPLSPPLSPGNKHVQAIPSVAPVLLCWDKRVAWAQGGVASTTPEKKVSWAGVCAWAGADVSDTSGNPAGETALHVAAYAGRPGEATATRRL